MSLKIIQAVHASHLEPRLRHLAATLAFYADDNGEQIWPSNSTVASNMGVRERAVQYGVEALVTTGVLQRDGYHGHMRQLRFDTERLGTYQPGDRPSKARPSGWRQQSERCNSVHPLSEAEGCNSVHPFTAADHPQPCTPLHPRGARGCTLGVHAIAPDLHDREFDREFKITAADAAGCSDQEKTAETEEQTEELAEKEDAPASPVVEPAKHPSQVPPFKVYAAIAQRALDISLFDDKSDNVGNISEHFKILCAQQGLPYGAFITQRAVDAALVSRENQKQQFFDKLRKLRDTGGLKPTSVGWRMLAAAGAQR